MEGGGRSVLSDNGWKLFYAEELKTLEAEFGVEVEEVDIEEEEEAVVRTEIERIKDHFRAMLEQNSRLEEQNSRLEEQNLRLEEQNLALRTTLAAAPPETLSPPEDLQLPNAPPEEPIPSTSRNPPPPSGSPPPAVASTSRGPLPHDETSVDSEIVILEPSEEPVNVHVVKLDAAGRRVKSRKRHARDVTRRASTNDYFCTCGFRAGFKSRAKLMKHLNFWKPQEDGNESEEYSFKCRLCPEKFSSQETLREHKETTHGYDVDNVPIKCRIDDCGAICGNRKLLIRHQRDTHGRPVKTRRLCKYDISVPAILGIFCTCGQRFTDMKSLNAHLLDRTGKMTKSPWKQAADRKLRQQPN